MYKKHQLGTLISVVVVLLAALAVGVGIRKIRLNQAEPKPQVERRESGAAAVGVTKAAKPTNLTEQDEDFLRWMDEETGQPEEAETVVEEQYAPQAEPTVAGVPQEGPLPAQPGQMAQRFGDWRNVWADLNLTQEEQARIREGFELARQRWQTMSAEERQAEMARMRTGWERWQNMSAQEREAAMQRIRQQFEEWRRSGRVELPIPSLD